MRWIDATCLAAAGVLAMGVQESLPSADAVLAELKAGNAHHVAKKYERPHQTAARQQALASNQSPHCAILTCADSRVPPEIVFDKGLGDIFDVRVAGNVAGDDETASLEYAAEHLHVPVIVVMGHTHCGAVSAALEGGTLPGKLPNLIALLRPAVDQSAHEPGDRLDNTVRDNVVHVVEQLRTAKPVLSDLVAAGKLRIVGAVYSLETGKVNWLSSAGSSRAGTNQAPGARH
jgi:carbonic anhydrase